MDLTDNLISYYKFDETSGTTATDSLGSNNGSIVGATINQTGLIDKCYSFDGSNDYINCNVAVIPTTSNADFTISCWVNVTSYGSGALVLSQYTGGTAGRFNAIQILNDGTFNCFFDGTQDNSGATKVPLSTWTHLMVIRDSGVVTGYINTSSVLSFNKTSSVENTNTLIGVDAVGSANYFNGLIDEVSVWDRALSADEVSELYNDGDGLTYPFSSPVTNTANMFLMF